MTNELFKYITTDDELADFCQTATGVPWIGFDTEFVSENRFQPELCLVQVSLGDKYFLIDALSISDLTPFWSLLVEGDHVTVAHAAREEFLFCLRACQRRPKRFFDVQLAAGMAGLEYPASYGNLVSRLLGTSINKGETRTDWRRRPLTDSQLAYALSDVVHLKPLYESLSSHLENLDRLDCFWLEMKSTHDDLERTEKEPQWHRVSGISNLNRKALAIVRELWLIRNEVAREKNRSPKRVLPDDLVVELAKRGNSDIKKLKAIRGIESRVSKSMFSLISEAVERANQLSEEELPKRIPRSQNTNLGLLGQFLNTAISVVCREKKIAPAIVGKASDIRKLAAWRLGMIKLDSPPSLASGWRSELVGDVIDQVLDGTIAIRVSNPKSEMPLDFEYLNRETK